LLTPDEAEHVLDLPVAEACAFLASRYPNNIIVMEKPMGLIVMAAGDGEADLRRLLGLSAPLLPFPPAR
jgi:hypothetical protein